MAKEEPTQFGDVIAAGLAGEDPVEEQDAVVDDQLVDDEEIAEEEAPESGDDDAGGDEVAEEESDDEEAGEDDDEEAEEPEFVHPYANQVPTTQGQHDPAMAARYVQLGGHPSSLTNYTPQGLAAAIQYAEQSLQQQPQAGRAPAAPGQQQGEFDPFQGVDPETLDDGHRKIIEGINGHYQGTISELNHRLARMEQAAQAQELSAMQDEFDRWVASKGDDWSDVFGEGPTSSMQTTEPTFVARDRIFSLGRNFSQVMPGMSQPQAWDRALVAELGDRHKKAARKEVIKSVKKASKRMVTKPQASKRRKQRGGDRIKNAVSAVGEKLKSFGDDPSEW